MSQQDFHRLAGLLSLGLSVTALAQSNPFPTYAPGENTAATTGPSYERRLKNPWVVSDGTIITPVGTQVYLGITTRAKAVAVNPTGNHTAAVLQMGAPQAVTIFNTESGAVLQTYSVPYTDPKGGTSYDSDGSTTGIAYTPDGRYLLFSQDGSRGPASFVSIASVDAAGMLTNHAQVKVPIDVDANGHLSQVSCFPNSPGATTGSLEIPCGYPFSIFAAQKLSSYPMGLAIASDARTAYAVLDNNDTLIKIDLTAATPVQGPAVRVGNVPHSVVIAPDGKTAYVSNEAGRIATADDFQQNSNGTPVVAEYPTGTMASGTVSVVDLSTFSVTGAITVGHHPTGMAFWGARLLVANTYSDSLSVIDTASNQEIGKIDLGLPIGIPGEHRAAYGAGPNSIAVDAANQIAYVALYNANAIAVIDLNASSGKQSVSWRRAILGMIPVGYAPASVALDTADNALLVANDKGIGTTGYGVKPPPTNTAENSYGKDATGAYGFNTHEDLGSVSIVPVPSRSSLSALTQQVFKNNHWDLAHNIWSAAGGSASIPPAVIPARIGDPSKIKHVFVIIRENRTYDQILGDVAGGNGDAALAVFGDHSTYGTYPVVTPNAHALVERFPLLDNFYDPSRQSADGHNWILQAIAPYGDDVQAPDWLRDYPANGGDAIAYQTAGHLFDVAAAAGIRMKIYGEYVEYNTFAVPGCTPSKQTQANRYNGTVPPATLPFVVSDSCEPSWTEFYNDTLLYEAGKEPQLQYFNAIRSFSALPNVMKYAVQNYPQFDLGIPDQYRVDVWAQDFADDIKNDSVPQLEFIWISSDHTGGPPTATAMQADNDLAVGRFVDLISHSPIWALSAIFVEEDDAQTGVDHVDGHRSPGYVISPYVKQNVNADGTGAGVYVDSTFYTQVNMTRTIEQILGLKPMNQNDLVASPMRTLFVADPPRANFLPWAHVPNGVPLTYGVSGYVAPENLSMNSGSPAVNSLPASPAIKALQAGWLKKKAELFAGKYHVPDAENAGVVSHYDWYEATSFMVPFPGEKTVRPASDFDNAAAVDGDDDD
jgi:YVTN family beta-propeller protein